MTKMLNLNVATVAVFADQPRARVRVRDGVLEVRPTERTITATLPKGEALRELKVRTKEGRVAGLAVSLDGFEVEVGTKYELVAAKHGWYKLNAAEAVVPGVMGASVGAK